MKARSPKANANYTVHQDASFAELVILKTHETQTRRRKEQTEHGVEVTKPTLKNLETTTLASIVAPLPSLSNKIINRRM